MSTDSPASGPEARLPMLAVFLLLLSLAACAPAADSPDDGAQAPPPRITAEHPVTARPALEAGLLDAGAMGGETALGDDGPVDGLGASLAAVLPAEDVAESMDFYAGLLGFDVMSSQPAEPPFQRVELARGGVRLVLLGPEAWEREMPRFGAAPAAGRDTAAGRGRGRGAGDDGAVDDDAEDVDPGNVDTVDGEAVDGEAVAEEGAPAPGAPGAVAGPVLRVALEDLVTVAEELTAAGVEIETRVTEVPDGSEATGGAPAVGSLAVVDPAGNRLLLVPAPGS